MTRAFTSPPNPSAFRAAVWEIVRRIPAGKVSTYGQIASMIPLREGRYVLDRGAFGARWVGGAMAACPDGVPWQRVVNGRGRISLARGGGYERQKRLLEAEGVEFSPSGTIDLDRFGWKGPGGTWLRKRGLEKPFPLVEPSRAKIGPRSPGARRDDPFG
jgi:methylated-DNA-protein-cysteine methyltransferase-like protein